jgi:hypothetical protein
MTDQATAATHHDTTPTGQDTRRVTGRGSRRQLLTRGAGGC